MIHDSSISGTDKDQEYSRFISLFMSSERAIRSYVRSLLLSSQDVDDLMQDIGLTCWRKFDQFDPKGSDLDFTRWCCVISRFEVLQFRRIRARDRLVLSEKVIQLLADQAEDRLERSEAERMALRDCLNKLSEPDRRLLLSTHTKGDSISRIASESDQRVRRLYSQVNKIRKQIANCVHHTISQGEPTS